jgi:hypothetical protein
MATIIKTLVIALFSAVLCVPLAYAQRLDFLTLNPTPEESFPEPAQPPATLLFGFAVAVDGNTALVSMLAASPPRIAVFTRDEGGQWLRTGTIGNQLGSLLALDGNYALVASDTAITAYRRTAQEWVRTQVIEVQASSLVMDGKVAVYVTSLPERLPSVHVLYRDHRGRWLRGPTLTPRDGGTWGTSLALSKNTLVVGASSQNDQRGAAYVFRRIGLSWREHQKLLAPEDDTRRFGEAVAVNGDRIVIGAPSTLPVNENSGQLTGAAYVFDRKGRFWFESQRLQPTGTNGFGSLLALTRSLLAVLSPAPTRFDDADVFIYEPNGPRRTYEQKGVVILGDFAGVTDLAASRNTVLIGVPFDSPFSTGHVAVYEDAPTP